MLQKFQMFWGCPCLGIEPRTFKKSAQPVIIYPMFFSDPDDIRVHILASNNFFERHIDTEIIYRNAVQFQVLGKFMFVTKYADTDKKHLDLFISMEGERFVHAR